MSHWDTEAPDQVDNAHYGGTLRISNPKTIQRWKDSGKWQEMLDEGYIYAEGCGRFRKFECTCHKCRRYHDTQ